MVTGQFAAPVNTHVQVIFEIEFEIKPGTPVGNDPRHVEGFAANGAAAPFSWAKKHPRRAVQLAHNDTFRAVNDERAVFRHKWHFTEVYFLLLHLANERRLTAASFFTHHQANHDPQAGPRT